MSWGLKQLAEVTPFVTGTSGVRGLCYYRITDSGIERSKALDEECDRMREACFSKLSDEELAQLTELLEKLIR